VPRPSLVRLCVERIRHRDHLRSDLAELVSSKRSHAHLDLRASAVRLDPDKPVCPIPADSEVIIVAPPRPRHFAKSSHHLTTLIYSHAVAGTQAMAAARAIGEYFDRVVAARPMIRACRSASARLGKRIALGGPAPR